MGGYLIYNPMKETNGAMHRGLNKDWDLDAILRVTRWNLCDVAKVQLCGM